MDYALRRYGLSAPLRGEERVGGERRIRRGRGPRERCGDGEERCGRVREAGESAHGRTLTP